jgi:hypothetical protein
MSSSKKKLTAPPTVWNVQRSTFKVIKFKLALILKICDENCEFINRLNRYYPENIHYSTNRIDQLVYRHKNFVAHLLSKNNTGQL